MKKGNDADGENERAYSIKFRDAVFSVFMQVRDGVILGVNIHRVWKSRLQLMAPSAEPSRRGTDRIHHTTQPIRIQHCR